MGHGDSTSFVAEVALVSRTKLLGLPGRHYGVALLDQYRNPLEVTDLTKDKGIRRGSWEGFLQGRDARIEDVITDYQDVGDAVWRIKEAEHRPWTYRLFRFNCENFARLMFDGEARSRQVALVIGVLSVAALIAAASR